MGKLASTGGLVTRDNEERKASAWLVGRSGASSGRALLAVSIGRRRRSVRGGGAGGAGGDVLVVPRARPIERNDFSGSCARSHLAFPASPRTYDDDRTIDRSRCSPHADDPRRRSRATAIETAVSHEEGLVRLGVSPLVSSELRQEPRCSSDDDVVEPGNERKYRWRYFERGASRTEDRIDRRSSTEAKRTERCAIARGRVRARTCARVHARARARVRARVRACRRRRRSRRRCPRRCWPAGSDKLSLLFGLATIVAVAATLCATAASAVPRESSPLSRTGPWHDLDRSTGLEDGYEDAFEDVFPEETRPTTSTVLDETELNIIRRSIARGLGLERIPDPSKANVSQAEYERAHNEYLKRVRLTNGRTDAGEKKLHVFSATAYPGNGSSRSPEVNHGEGHCRHRLYFPVEIPVQDRRRASPTVDHATLRLLLHAPSSSSSSDDDDDDNDDDDNAQLSELDALLYFDTSSGSRKLIFRRRVESRHLRNSKWLEFDATVAVNSWLDAALDNLSLELEFRSAGKPVRRNFSAPFLNVFTATSGRAKRSSPEELMSLHKGRRTKCKGESKKCCRHELTVMFKDLKGFEFIVYPKTFDAGYCKGRCPPRYNPAHHHALLQSLLWKEDRKKVPKPCCAPSKLDQLMIVYFDENDSTQLKVSYWNNIQVLECACS